MNYRSVATLSRAITHWLDRLPKDWDLVVGIPRSGMLPASLMALHLNVPIADFAGYLSGRILDSGRRGPGRETERRCKKVLVIDDSVNTGGQIEQARKRVAEAGITDEVHFAALYVTPGSEHHVDHWYEQIESPRVFEWNIMHHSLLLSSCLDIDGVLCRDPSEKENDDADAYLAFLESAEPKFLPSVPVGWLVTSRLEKYRSQTEAWMVRHGINFRELIMMQAKSKDERIASGSHAQHKADAYAQTGADLFIESSVIQAVEIASRTGKAVFCTETMELVVIQSDAVEDSFSVASESTTGQCDGITKPPDPEDWPSKLQLTVSEILQAVPANDAFILIDNDQLGMHRVFAGRRPIPFLESNGLYAGPPADSDTAIQSFEHVMQKQQPSRLVLAWPAFWWREHYLSFAEYLIDRYPIVLDNSRLLILDLTRGIA